MKGEQFVAIVFVLLFAGGDLGGKPLREIMAECIETIEDGDDFLRLYSKTSGKVIFRTEQV